jgi:hypothetical protein
MINSKQITMKASLARIKRPGEIKTIRAQVKDTTKRYLTSLKGKRSPFVIALQKKMLSLDNKIISLEELDLILSDYPEALLSQSKLRGIENEIVLNKAVMALSLYFNGVLHTSFIVTDEGIRKFTVI